MSEKINPSTPTPRSTSVLLSTEVEYIPADDLLYYFSEQVGMTFEDYLEGEVINGVTNSVLTFFGSMLKPQVLALIQFGITVAEICNAIKVKALLTARQYRRIWMYLAEGKSITEIAKAEGLSKASVSRSIAAALHKLRKLR